MEIEHLTTTVFYIFVGLCILLVSLVFVAIFSVGRRKDIPQNDNRDNKSVKAQPKGETSAWPTS